MAYEELGLNKEEQIQLRARAVYSVLKERRLETKAKDPVISAEVEFRIDELITKIQKEQGVDEREAILILAEQLILSIPEGEE